MNNLEAYGFINRRGGEEIKPFLHLGSDFL